MTVRVEVREGEELRTAIRRLDEMVNRNCRRKSHKRRLGYYEKPGVRRRRSKQTKRINQAGFQSGAVHTLKNHLGLRSLHQRKA